MNEDTQMTHKSTIAMIRISGPKIRSLREHRGLTQLYLATAVEVTTETISRWERTSSPNIKKENGLKLAASLDVELDEILVKSEPIPEKVIEKPDGDDVHKQKPPFSLKKKVIVGLFILAIFAGLITSISFFFVEKEHIKLHAVRILPPHTVTGQPFPIVIQVAVEAESPGSFLIQESIPPGCVFLSSTPPATVQNKRLIKWINRKGGSNHFAYLAKLTTKPGRDEVVKFSGEVKLRKEGYEEVMIEGNNTIQMRPYHWADKNRDSIINDDEILAVYDDFAKIENLQIDIEQIEEMWMGESYIWNREENIFKIIEN